MQNDFSFNRNKIAHEVAENTKAMLAYWDVNLICRFANSSYFEWFGFKPEEMVDKMNLKQLLGSLFESNLPYIKNALDGKVQIFEREIITPAGLRRSTIATYTPDFVAGKVSGFYVHVADITALKTKQLNKNSDIFFDQELYGPLVTIKAVEKTLRSFLFIGFPGIPALAKQHLISESKLKRDFKAQYKSTIFNYFRRVQMEFADTYISEKKYSKKQVAEILKFSNSSNFLVCYQKYLKEKAAKNLNADAEKVNDNLYKIFVSQAPVAIAMFDKDLMFMAASQKWISDYQMEGKHLMEIGFHDIFPSGQSGWLDVHKRCLEGETDCGEELVARKDESNFWLRWNMRPWLNTKNETGGLIVFTEDISLLKQAAAEKKCLLDMLLAFDSANSVGSWERNFKTSKTTWSKITREILELPTDYEPGTQPELHFYKNKKDRQQLTRLLKLAFKYQQSFELTADLVTSKGNPKKVRIIGFSDFSNGVCERIYGILQDVTAVSN